VKQIHAAFLLKKITKANLFVVIYCSFNQRNKSMLGLN